MANQNEKATIDLVINGQQSQAKLYDIKAAAIDARKALVKMAETDPGYKEQLALYHKLAQAQKDRIAAINGEKTAWQQFKAQGAGIVAGVAGGNLVSAGVQKILELGPKLVDTYKQFDSASADMSANLGLNAKDVEYFNQKAQEMGPAMGKSAAEMLDAFKLVGSANSDLVKTPELLADVADKSVVLSQASKMTLADATASLVGSMNQFDAGADQSQRFINVMAGGAQVGSAEIGDMAASLKASGLVAHTVGLSFEETNGALQSLSKESLKGEQSGTMLRNILLTLSSGADEYNPKVVGLQKALDNLGKKNMSVTEMTKMFKTENVTAALSLINHRDRVAEFTKGLTGTSAAYDMAAKNNATLNHQTELFWAKIDKAALWLAGKLVPALSSALGWVNKMGDALPQMGQWLQKNGEWLLITGVPALLAYNGALIKATTAAAANTIAEGYRQAVSKASAALVVIQTTATATYSFATGVLTGQISLQTAAVTIARNVWAFFNAVLLANPIGLVVVALTALVAGIKYFSEHTARALDVERKKQALQRQGVKDTQASTKALQDLTAKMGHYNELSKAEQENLKRTIVLKQQETRARLQAALAKSREIAREAADPNFWQGMKQGATDFLTGNWGNLAGKGLEQQKQLQAEANKAQAYAEAKAAAGVEELQTALAGFDKLLQQPGQSAAASGGGGTGGGGKGKGDKNGKKGDDLKRKEDEYQKLLNDARERTAKLEDDEFTKDQLAFGEHYQKLYELAGTNKEKMEEVTRVMYIELGDIQKKHSAKQAAEQQKADLEDLKSAQKLAEKELELRRQMTLKDIQNRVAVGGISKEEGKKLELQAEQQFLVAKELLYSQHYESMMNAAWGNDEALKQVAQDLATSLTDIDKAQLDSEGEIATARAELKHAEMEHDLELFEKKKQMAAAELSDRKQMTSALFAVMQNDWTSTLESNKKFWRESTVVQKAAFLAQKAFALAEIGINLARQITLITTMGATMNAYLPGLGTGAMAGGILKAIGTAAAQTASVMGVQMSVPAFAEGGFTSTDAQPSGYTKGATYFRKGNFIGGEAGREWIMSAPMLQNPVMANLAGALQALQLSGDWKKLSYSNAGSGGGSSAGGSDMTTQLLAAIHQQLQVNNDRMEAISKRPIQNHNSISYHLLQDAIDENKAIDQATSL